MCKRYPDVSMKLCLPQVKRDFKIVKDVLSRFQLSIDKCKDQFKMVPSMVSDTLTDCVRS